MSDEFITLGEAAADAIAKARIALIVEFIGEHCDIAVQYLGAANQSFWRGEDRNLIVSAMLLDRGAAQ